MGLDQEFVDETHIEQAVVKAFESASAHVIAVVGIKGMCVKGDLRCLVGT